METVYLLVIVQAGLIIALGAMIILSYWYIKKTEQRMTEVEQSLRYFSAGAKDTADFAPNGAGGGGNIPGEPAAKQKHKANTVNRLASEMENVWERLEIFEEILMEKKTGKKRVDKVIVDKILILSNQGFSPAEISPKLGVPPGEIELVIKLRKYTGSPPKEKL